MAEVAPAPAAAPAKAAKKKTSKPKKAGPSVQELIVKTVAASKERSGVSAAALKKALAAGGYDDNQRPKDVEILPFQIKFPEVTLQKSCCLKSREQIYKVKFFGKAIFFLDLLHQPDEGSEEEL